MSLFQQKPKETRTTEDILTPKEVEDNIVGLEDEVDIGEGMSEKESEANANETSEKETNKDIQVESPEEVSFNALTCFGWSETKTPKWLIKCAQFWYGTMSFLWFVFGALTFAPIIFMQRKANVIFKDKLKSFFVAAIIYAVFLTFIIVLIASRNGDKVQEVVNEAGESVLS